MNIPEEAIEAAADAIIERSYGQELPEAPEDLARAALEAALPYLYEANRPKSSTDWPDIPRGKR